MQTFWLQCQSKMKNISGKSTTSKKKKKKKVCFIGNLAVTCANSHAKTNAFDTLSESVSPS